MLASAAKPDISLETVQVHMQELEELEKAAVAGELVGEKQLESLGKAFGGASELACPRPPTKWLPNMVSKLQRFNRV